MRQRRRIRMAMALATCLPVAVCAATPSPVVPTWLAVLPDLVCALAALALVAFALWLLKKVLVDDSAAEFSLRRHAGGFGGTSTGWRVSTPLARLVAGLVLVVLAVALGMARVKVHEGGESAPSPAASAPSAASAASAAASAPSTR